MDLAEAKEASSRLFGIVPERSTITTLFQSGWSDFASAHNIDPGAAGVYLHETFEAIVNAEVPFKNVTTLHEFFGHGLFVEHTALGQQRHRGERPKDPRLHSLYEGVGILVEETLAEALGLEQEFYAKLPSIGTNPLKTYEHYGTLADAKGLPWLLYAAGFPKHYDLDKARKILLKNYPGNPSNIIFALLYGSRKPHSDIDYFVVTEESSKQLVDGVLDIASISREEFHHRLKHLDIAVTDPLFTGEVLIGEGACVDAYRRFARKLPVTEETISYALWAAQEQEEHAHPLTGFDPVVAASYAASYRVAAFRMVRGEKILTKKDLL